MHLGIRTSIEKVQGAIQSKFMEDLKVKKKGSTQVIISTEQVVSPL